jgi:predicted NAD/FAD-binding protein
MKVAIIGGGVAGLTAARLLYKTHEITLFEKNDYVGGHANTISLSSLYPGLVVDSGFIVFNHHNYPEFRSMLSHLNVDTVATEMSFSVSDRKNPLEFSSTWPNGIFADRRNIFRPTYWRFLCEIRRFNTLGKKALQQGEQFQQWTLETFVKKEKFITPLINQYLIPMAAAIWSAPFKKILDFPLIPFLKFLDNHGLLTVNQHPQWYTVKGGSRVYVNKLILPFRDNICHQEIISVQRQEEGVAVTSLTNDKSLNKMLFDQVIFASHANETLNVMKTLTPEEINFLKGFPYAKNDVYLHQDESFMPQRRDAWASWNTLISKDYNFENPVCVTYWMNNLQHISIKFPLFITLNPSKKPQNILKTFSYDHPMFTCESLREQKNLSSIQGKDRIWYCGSYVGYGFHEDALKSGMDVALKLGGLREWERIDA